MLSACLRLIDQYFQHTVMNLSKNGIIIILCPLNTIRREAKVIMKSMGLILRKRKLFGQM
jgi:hypothetical protein